MGFYGYWTLFVGGNFKEGDFKLSVGLGWEIILIKGLLHCLKPRLNVPEISKN